MPNCYPPVCVVRLIEGYCRQTAIQTVCAFKTVVLISLFPRHEMLIVLPNERNGLPGLLQTLTANGAEYARILGRDNYVSTWVRLGLPRFSIHGDTIPLAEKLASMGLSSLFGGDADLSGITGRRDLYVESFQHKALIDVSALIDVHAFYAQKVLIPGLSHQRLP